MPPLDLTLPLLGLFGCAVLVGGGPGSSLLLLGHSVLNWSLCGDLFIHFLYFPPFTQIGVVRETDKNDKYNVSFG
jgi:hypothetical protein